jgi:two-component system response regulator FixJ
MADDPVTVYIVDDDDAVRAALASLLELEDYAVRQYEAAEPFLGDIAGDTAGILLLDVRLPDINGLEVQSRLVEMGSKLSVIIITGHGDVPMAVQAIQAGAVNFIEKPFIGDAVIDNVRAAEADARDAMETVKETQDLRDRYDQLAPRERDVLRHLVKGQQNKVIAFELGISPRTVEVYRARLMTKMQAKSLAVLVRMAMNIGIDTEEISGGNGFI